MSRAVALTLGDPAGIGGEIALKAWTALSGEVPFFLIGDVAHMAALAACHGLAVTEIAAPQDAASAGALALPVLHHPLPRQAPPGRPDPANAAAVVAIIARGVALVRAGAGWGSLESVAPEWTMVVSACGHMVKLLILRENAFQNLLDFSIWLAVRGLLLRRSLHHR